MIETIRFPLTGKRNVGTQIIMYPAKINKILQKTGFKNNIIFDGDGKINLTGTKEVKNFYPKTKYKMTNVYEFVCEKKNLVLVLLRTLLGEKTIETFTYLEPITNFI